MPRNPHHIQARRYGMRPSQRNFRKSRGWKLPPGTRYSIHGLWYGPAFVIRNPDMKPLLHRGRKP